MSRFVLGLDIGSNSVGSAWIDRQTGKITTGVSVFPAGVDESDDKRGEPKNAKRRMTRRTRITLARRAARKRALRLKLIDVGLLPVDEADFKGLLEATDPWELRRRGLDEALSPFEFGRVLLHLAQRRGALGLKIAGDDEDEENSADSAEDGKVKAAIGVVRAKMLERKARTFGEFIAMVREERVTPIESEDKRKPGRRKGPREWRGAVRNKAKSYEHCAERPMIRHEFGELWKAQSAFGGDTAAALTEEFRLVLDNPDRDGEWRHKGLLFGQRAANWDLGMLGRCVLEPSERCVPHADMYASRYRVIETVNNLKIRESDKPERPLTEDERARVIAYLSGPLGEETRGKRKGQPKRTVSVTDLRNFMGTSKEGWGRATKTSRFHFNIEADDERAINTDWFAREIVHGAIGVDAWAAMPANLKEGFNRAVLRHDPDENGHAERLKSGLMRWGGLDEVRADALIAAWKARPRPDAKRLNMSRRAVRNLLTVMERASRDEKGPIGYRWPTQIEARKAIAGDGEFVDVTTGKPLDDVTRRRYATGAKGATARDRYYMNKHVLMKGGQPVVDRATGELLAEPPPAPLISNPVVRKAIHEVRRHIVEYMLANGRKPDEVYVELAREARMGKLDADIAVQKNRLQNRIGNEIIDDFGLAGLSKHQQREAVRRVVLCVQQDGVCPLCGNQLVATKITPRMAAEGIDCEIAHIVPRASSHNGFGNIVLSHTRCNREMGRRTPREYWNDMLPGGFKDGMDRVKAIYGDIRRIKPSEAKSATGLELWKCYLTQPARPRRGSNSPTPRNVFTNRFDKAKIKQFEKSVSDPEIQDMTSRQEAATKYAARQVMAYVSDGLFDGHGLPERATGSGSREDARRVFASDGMWTSRLRREWGLFFDSHGARAHGLDASEENNRKEKNRGDHHHHAIDAVVIALGSRSIQLQWEQREKAGDAAYWANGGGASYEGWMENYRRNNRLRPPKPFDRPDLPLEHAIESFRGEVQRSVFGEDGAKPICHRPVKRKLVGYLHKETQQGPVLDVWRQNGVIHKERVAGRTTVRQDVLGEAKSDFLKPNHLRLPRPETDNEAIERIARRLRVGKAALSHADALKQAKKVVTSTGFMRKMVDPKPEKSGLVRDIGLRRHIYQLLESRGLNPDSYTKSDLKRSIDQHGPLSMKSGVPIHRVVLLWSNSDPVEIQRVRYEYATGERRKDQCPEAVRLYDSQNNHHIEIRENEKGKWTGAVVTGYETAQRKLRKLHAFREAGVPKPKYFRDLKKDCYARWQRERAQWRPVIAKIEANHPLVDRSDNGAGRFVMSLCEGETVWMKHKHTGEVGYFVVAKLDKPQSIVLVPHWDARAASERKDSDGKKVPGSKREQFAVTPSDLRDLAPPGEPHARKVRVSPLGDVTALDRD